MVARASGAKTIVLAKPVGEVQLGAVVFDSAEFADWLDTVRTSSDITSSNGHFDIIFTSYWYKNKKSKSFKDVIDAKV